MTGEPSTLLDLLTTISRLKDTKRTGWIDRGVDPALTESVADHVLIDVDQFYGIEIEEFPAQIAQVAMWLMDHQMNLRVAEQFGENVLRLPLRKSATIVHDNALRIDWNEVVPAAELDYILGNPPFIGSKMMTAEQRKDLLAIAGPLKGAGILDFVCGWYLKSADYIGDLPTRAAFVSTSSITQGEQVGSLWSEMLRHDFHIFFAHRTFQWNNEARGVAAVHCVIVGFAKTNISPKRLFDYEDIRGEPHEVTANNINPYLVDSHDLLLPNRSKPISPVPEIGIGNKPIDGGYYLFTTEERDAFIASEPASAKWFHRWLGSDEFINGWERWCLWLGNCPPAELRQMPEAMKRVDAVRRFRLGIGPNKDGKSLKDGKQRPESTRKLAETPTRFHVENMPPDNYLVIPKVSSERRTFIPIGFMSSDTLCSDLVFIAPASLLSHFGIVTSTMHMAWVRAVCGRLESRYRYSAGIVYNNFPWPDAVDDKHRTAIEVAAQGVLDTRARFPEATLADLYDPLTMPPALLKAHQQLDKAVDAGYLAAEKVAGRKAPRLGTDAERVTFLFQRYQALTSLLPTSTKSKPARRRKAQA